MGLTNVKTIIAQPMDMGGPEVGQGALSAGVEQARQAGGGFWLGGRRPVGAPGIARQPADSGRVALGHALRGLRFCGTT